MKLINNGIRMEMTIDSYEFPYYEHNTYDDNNWLNVSVEWEDDVILEAGVSPSLTTIELQDLYQGLSKALKGADYHSSFKEDHLQIHVTQEKETIQMEMSYAKPGHNRLSCIGEITKEQISEMISDVHEMCIRFPERKKKMLH